MVLRVELSHQNVAQLLDLPEEDSEAAAAGRALLSFAAAASEAGWPGAMSRRLLEHLYQAVASLYQLIEQFRVVLAHRLRKVPLVVEGLVIGALRVMILSIPVAEVNTIILGHRILISRIDRLDFDLVESFKHFCHKLRSTKEVAIRHNPARLFTAPQLFLMISNQFLIRLHKALQEVHEACKRLASIFVLYIWHWHSVLLFRQVEL